MCFEIVDKVTFVMFPALLLSVCVSGFVSSVLATLITSATCLVMKKRMGAKEPEKTTPIQAPPPIYDTVTEDTGKDTFELTGNIAYAPIKS